MLYIFCSGMQEHQFWKYLSDPEKTKTLRYLSFRNCQNLTPNIMIQIIHSVSENLKRLYICDATEPENAPPPEVCHAFIKVVSIIDYKFISV